MFSLTDPSRRTIVPLEWVQSGDCRERAPCSERHEVPASPLNYPGRASMNILAVVAHPDDELLGCGATLRRLADKGNSVFTVVLCSTADARHARPSLGRLYEIAGESERIVGITDSLKYEFKNIQFNTVPHLDMVRAIETAIEKFRPSWVFTHHVGDLNVDHRVCYEAVMAAVRLPQRRSRDL